MIEQSSLRLEFEMAEIALQPKRWTIDEYHQLIETGLLGGAHVELLIRPMLIRVKRLIDISPVF
jgi:hypothetical protein